MHGVNIACLPFTRTQLLRFTLPLIYCVILTIMVVPKQDSAAKSIKSCVFVILLLIPESGRLVATVLLLLLCQSLQFYYKLHMAVACT